ncbi:hypothetical protein PHYPSEUDO_013926 [Phytophthora pseudosyringae]|uniref:Uncharacterized protein n=1 Tax=Phytophthora pseudosyringae TaxID=221518 RepID=A0A8T1V5P5_9STRA|nr:hypothetical protein PHYPSEUDO_013926 [Phytophthora pseudosyringae]
MSTALHCDHQIVVIRPSDDWTMDDEDLRLLAAELDPVPTPAEVSKWPHQLKAQRRLQLHRKRMIRLRTRRAAEKKTTLEEFQSLEPELQKRIADLRRTGVRSGNGEIAHIQRDMQRLVLERELLRQESVTLRQNLSRHQKYAMVIQVACPGAVPAAFDEDLTAQSTNPERGHLTVRCIGPEWQTVQKRAGYRVHVPEGLPSFVFHPFSQQEFDAVLGRHDSNARSDASQLAHDGNYLGWEVSRGANVPGNHWLLGHVRCKKRLNRSIDSVLNSMKRDDGTSKWPITPTAEDVHLTGEISTQTLQHLDENSYVMLSNYPGSPTIRYMCLVRQSPWKFVLGKRAQTFYFVVADSEANRRSRDAASATKDEVCWITDEGGYSLTLEEVDDKTVDVIFHSFAYFTTEEQALHHFLMFGRIVTRWEQLVMSLNLLQC